MTIRKRNYGYGRGLKYSAKQALKMILGSRFSTIASHYNRFVIFANFCQKNNTNNAVFITLELFNIYAQILQDKVTRGELSTAYAHNLISSVNVVMHAYRRDKKIWLSPKSLFGPRCHIRKVAPNLSIVAVILACKTIRKLGYDEIALIVWLARVLGIRLKEAILLDAKKALKQAVTTGFVDIRKGTKGGRGKKVQRLIPVNKRIILALNMAVKVQGGRNSFIPKNEKLITFYRRIHRVALPILKEFDLSKIHDLRAAFTCFQYKIEIGVDAPVVSGISVKKTLEVKEKLKVVSNRIGHNREYVIDSYCGS